MTAEGAALNAVWPYYTMYPLDFPLRVLRRHGKPGEWVIDPFCGRGTTNFAARLLGMPSVGIDSSPVAAALAKAKLVYATPERVHASAEAILAAAKEPTAIPSGSFWALAYDPRTLYKLCQLREALLEDCASASRILLRAILLGALHGPRPKGKPSYFSNQAPRTFAQKPKYAVKFWTARGMRPEDVDVLAIIKDRADRYLTSRPPDVDGMVHLADSRKSEAFRDAPKAGWIVTSPPYYGMRGGRYGRYLAAFAAWLERDAADPVRLLGLVLLAGALPPGVVERVYDHEAAEDPVASLLNVTWKRDEPRLRKDTEAFGAFRRLLRWLADEQNALALDLVGRIGGLS